MIKIMLDPGHSYDSPGARGASGTFEEDLNLAVAQMVYEKLKYVPNISARLTRYGNRTGWNTVLEDVSQRVALANAWLADFFISIHSNSASNQEAHGFELYILRRGGEAEKLAKCLSENIVAGVGLTNRGIKEKELYVLKYTKMPAVLIEMGFISNPGEEQLLNLPSIQEKYADAIVNGLVQYLYLERSNFMFKDVDPDNPYVNEIKEVASAKLMIGDDKGNFRPKDPVTREELAVVLSRLLKLLRG